MRTYYQQVKEHEGALLRAQEVRDNGITAAKEKYESLLTFYTQQYEKMVKKADRELEKARLRSGVRKTPSHTVQEVSEPPLTKEEERAEVFTGLGNLLDTHSEDTSVSSEEEDDMFDLSGMTERGILGHLRELKKRGITLPSYHAQKLQELEESQKKKSDIDVPPPRPATLSKQEEKRKPLKQVKGYHSYQLPIDE